MGWKNNNQIYCVTVHNLQNTWHPKINTKLKLTGNYSIYSSQYPQLSRRKKNSFSHHKILIFKPLKSIYQPKRPFLGPWGKQRMKITTMQLKGKKGRWSELWKQNSESGGNMIHEQKSKGITELTRWQIIPWFGTKANSGGFNT